MNRTRIVAAFAVLALAGCGGSAAAQHAPATTPPPPVSSAAAATTPPSAPGAAFCATLKTADVPLITYENELIRQVGLVSDGGSASPADIAAAKTIVALWITISCPQFAYLTKDG